MNNNNPLFPQGDVPPQQMPPPYYYNPYQGMPYNGMGHQPPAYGTGHHMDAHVTPYSVPPTPIPAASLRSKLHIISFGSAIASLLLTYIPSIGYSLMMLESGDTTSDSLGYISSTLGIVGFALVIVAIVTGHLALQTAKGSERRLAKAGLIIGYLSIVLPIIGIGLVIVGIVFLIGLFAGAFG